MDDMDVSNGIRALSSYKGPMLKGVKSYKGWAKYVTMFLKGKRLLGYIDGRLQRPELLDPIYEEVPERPEGSKEDVRPTMQRRQTNQRDVEERATEREDYEVLEAQVFTFLLHSMDERNQREIRDLEEPHLAWKRIAEKFALEKAAASRAHQLQSLQDGGRRDAVRYEAALRPSGVRMH